MRWVAPLSVLVAALAAGCGGSEDNADSGLPKALMVKRADAICSQARRDIRAQVPRGNLGTLGALTAASVSDQVAPKYLKKLERLNPRAADAKQWRAYIGAEQTLMRVNRRAIEESHSKEDFLSSLTEARGPSANSERAAAAFGLKACTRGPNTHVGTGSTPASANERPGETKLRKVGITIRTPEGWRRKQIDGPNAEAFGDDVSDCGFLSDRDTPPGSGSQAALYDYAQAQVANARRKADGYRLVALETQRAQNATGVAIVRSSRKGTKRYAGRVAFFFTRGRRYVVDCYTHDPKRLADLDKGTFEPVARSVRITGPGH